MEVNFFGPLGLARAFAPTMRRPGGGLIFVLSVSAVALSRSAPVYSASKAACLMLALDLREELRDSGATVTVVPPGFIDTDMGAAFGSTAKATPAQIAALSLDGWLSGQHTIWPDRFAELVRDTVGEPFRALLDEPRQVMSAVHASFRNRAAPGS
jgi:NAD(P)-dependent dehydrogenase (short-subunit alcohol dehydrogenase family)